MNTIRHRRLSAAIRCALPVLLLPALALAQDEPRELDRVEVTGSRIKKSEIEGQSPIQANRAKSGTRIAAISSRWRKDGSGLMISAGNFSKPPIALAVNLNCFK